LATLRPFHFVLTRKGFLIARAFGGEADAAGIISGAEGREIVAPSRAHRRPVPRSPHLDDRSRERQHVEEQQLAGPREFPHHRRGEHRLEARRIGTAAAMWFYKAIAQSAASHRGRGGSGFAGKSRLFSCRLVRFSRESIRPEFQERSPPDSVFWATRVALEILRANDFVRVAAESIASSTFVVARTRMARILPRPAIAARASERYRCRAYGRHAGDSWVPGCHWSRHHDADA